MVAVLGHFILVELAYALMASKWWSRGWTFQENLLACRKIVFQGETVNWECRCAAWHEAYGPADDKLLLLPSDATPSGSTLPQDTLQPAVVTSSAATISVAEAIQRPWPNLYRYARLVSLYSQKQLSDPGDVLDVFEGVITTLSPNYVGGFVTGLPQMFFDSALLWQPFRAMPRRSGRKSSLPSWSWVGWHGDFNSHSWRSGYSYMRKNPDEYLERDESVWQPTSWKVVSTVKWYYVDSSNNSRHPIDACGQQHCDPSEQPLPAAWTRSLCSETGRHFFRHQSDSEQEFSHPIPLPEANSPPPPHVRASRIWCRTRRGVLKVGEEFRNKWTGTCLCADLVDEGGGWAGALRYHRSRRSRQPFNEHELIELSAGSVLDQETERVSIDEWFRPECPRRSGKYEFYNVMAIRRHGRGAFRLRDWPRQKVYVGDDGKGGN